MLVHTLAIRFHLLLKMITIVIAEVIMSQFLATFTLIMTHYGQVKDAMENTHAAINVVCDGLVQNCQKV